MFHSFNEIAKVKTYNYQTYTISNEKDKNKHLFIYILFQIVIYLHLNIHFFHSMYIIDNKKMVPLVNWKAGENVLIKIYKPDLPEDWTGLKWMGNKTSVPSDTPKCGWKGELCEVTSNTLQITIITAFILIIIIVLLLGIGWISLKRKRQLMALKVVESALVKWENVKDEEENTDTDRLYHRVYQYNDLYVVATPLDINSVNITQMQVFAEVLQIRELNDLNVNPFVGICPESPNVCILMEYASRGSLSHIIEKMSTQLDINFKTSILADIASGMLYLHESPVGSHGRLTSSLCVLDSKWTCKITGHGLDSLRNDSLYDRNPLYKANNPSKLLWIAPELLENNTKETQTVSSKQMGDVYSFGIITQEIVLGTRPYEDNDVTDAETIIDRVRQVEDPPFRPNVDAEQPELLRVLMTDCWQQEPNLRPKFKNIRQTIYRIRRQKGMQLSLIDDMIHKLEVYTGKLEEKVLEKRIEIQEEKSKVEVILSELLPESIAKQLARGEQIQPEVFDCITLFFSDIVGFTKIAAAMDAIDLVTILNKVYSMFDDVLSKFDVYKVATIGDAYMVASGVPIRNGDRHAQEICSMALGLLDTIGEYTISDTIEEHLCMRIGIHTGPCVAGVAGIKMPRYLLFGDTVDIAAKMESGGESMKIHISETTLALIRICEEYKITERGIFEVKQKQFITYWLSAAQ